MTEKQLRQEIDDYLRNLILNSTFEDWRDAELIEDNIKIILDDGSFRVTVYSDNTLQTEKDWFFIRTEWSWNKEKRKSRNELNKKFKEIRSYFRNTAQYKRTLETYNLLPIKEQRRKKLEEIKSKI